MFIKNFLNLTKENSVGTYNPSAVNNPLFRFKCVIEYKRKDPMNRVADFFRTEYKKLVRKAK